MTHRVSRHLRLEIDAYDESIRRFIPGYEAMISKAADEVAAVHPDQVLDLGAGTGGLSSALLRRTEVGRVELLDVDPEMLARARTRLANFGDRAQFTDASFEDVLPACDAAASSLALHHIPKLEDKTAVYRQVFEALPNGGVFVNADATMPVEPAAKEKTFRGWADHMVASGIDEKLAWQHFEEWAEEDTYFSLEQELTALQAAGFDTKCSWRHGPIAVIVGTKSGD